MYCTVCGNKVNLENTKECNLYYDTLTCPDCKENANKPLKVEPKAGIVYKRWLYRLAILSDSPFIHSSIYHPLSGELIPNIELFLKQTGFLLDY